MVDIPFWKKEKRTREEERINVPFALNLTKSEKIWVKDQAEIDCCSANSIIRKALRLYKIKIGSP